MTSPVQPYDCDQGRDRYAGALMRRRAVDAEIMQATSARDHESLTKRALHEDGIIQEVARQALEVEPPHWECLGEGACRVAGSAAIAAS